MRTHVWSVDARTQSDVPRPQYSSICTTIFLFSLGVADAVREAIQTSVIYLVLFLVFALQGTSKVKYTY